MSSTPPLPGTVAHFAINADDVERGRTFYERVFGWQFRPWGPPGFYQIENAGAAPGPLGALQGRRELAGGARTVGFECTIAVTDVKATCAAIVAAGGTIVLGP